MTEAKALRELKNGSQEALGWFIDQYTPYVTTVIYNIIGQTMSQADIEEVAADVFFAFWNNAHKVRLSSVRGYLGSIARNMAKNKSRQTGRELPLDDNIMIVDALSLETRVEKQELEQIVRNCVLQMSYPEREIFLRFYYYYQTLEQISQEMGINLSTVKTKLRRGRENLKNILTKQLT